MEVLGIWRDGMNVRSIVYQPVTCNLRLLARSVCEFTPTRRARVMIKLSMSKIATHGAPSLVFREQKWLEYLDSMDR